MKDPPKIRGKKHEKGKPYSGNIYLRIEPALHERVAKLADLEKRSLNGQVEWLLTVALTDYKNH